MRLIANSAAEAIAEFIEREAGHIIGGMLLMLIGAALWKLGVPNAEDVLPFALGVIARSMVGRKKGKADENKS